MPTATTRPLLVEALDRWRHADEAFVRARSHDERGAAMVAQLRARGAIFRLSEFETLLTHRLRALVVEEGVWSDREALERLDSVDFTVRANALRSLAPVLSNDCLGRALERLGRTLQDPDPKGRWWAERGLAEAWAARGRIDRSSDRDCRAHAQSPPRSPII